MTILSYSGDDKVILQLILTFMTFADLNKGKLK